MTIYPTIENIIEQLRQFKAKSGFTDEQLAAALTAFGWTWLEAHLTALFAGRVKVTQRETIFLQRYLLHRFLLYNIS